MLTKPLDPDVEGADGQLSRDTVFETLSNSRRRFVIEFLHRNAPGGDTVSLREISEQLAANENGIEAVEVTYKQRKRVYTSLYQSHLPKLYRNGIVEYDKRAGTVALTKRVAEFESYFQEESNTSPNWTWYWLGLGSVSFLLSVLLWSQNGAVGPLDAPVTAVVVAAAVFCSALAYAATTRQPR